MTTDGDTDKYIGAVGTKTRVCYTCEASGHFARESVTKGTNREKDPRRKGNGRDVARERVRRCGLGKGPESGRTSGSNALATHAEAGAMFRRSVSLYYGCTPSTRQAPTFNWGPLRRSSRRPWRWEASHDSTLLGLATFPSRESSRLLAFPHLGDRHPL